jgi:hypothetical protein
MVAYQLDGDIEGGRQADTRQQPPCCQRTQFWLDRSINGVSAVGTPKHAPVLDDTSRTTSQAILSKFPQGSLPMSTLATAEVRLSWCTSAHIPSKASNARSWPSRKHSFRLSHGDLLEGLGRSREANSKHLGLALLATDNHPNVTELHFCGPTG